MHYVLISFNVLISYIVLISFNGIEGILKDNATAQKGSRKVVKVFNNGRIYIRRRL